jgi:hypothetical protein
MAVMINLLGMVKGWLGPILFCVQQLFYSPSMIILSISKIIINNDVERSSANFFMCLYKIWHIQFSIE